MGTCSSGEDLVVKARKPYTITKQREKWTEEEHNKFLEALKLYGRAWQRIEEHIGSKTAVQIRSHAQKFFSKLEKEAQAKGIPLGEVQDIEIPPPRPKRKPTTPYPRKICDGVVSICEKGNDVSSSFSSLHSKKKTTDLANDLDEKRDRKQLVERTRETGEFGPSDRATDNERTPIIEETIQDVIDTNADSLHQLSIHAEGKLLEEKDIQTELQKCSMALENDARSSKNYPKLVPVNSIDGQSNGNSENGGCNATKITSVSNNVEVNRSFDLGKVPGFSGAAGHNNSASMSSVQQPFVTYPPPFLQYLGTQDAVWSSNNESSMFSSLIVSTLLQNPAVHSAASLAASFWPTAEFESSIGSCSGSFVGGFPVAQTNSSPSMAAIAAATVAAASAWWAIHGMLPFCHPFQNCFTFAQVPTSTIPRTEMAHVTDKEGEVEVDHGHLEENEPSIDPSCTKILGTKSRPFSLSESDDNHGRGTVYVLKPKSVAQKHPNTPPDSLLPESVKAICEKKNEYSSCGSNAFYDGKVQSDKILKNLEEGEEESRAVNLTDHSSMDPNNRRSRGSINMNKSWKEVSEEGRHAFRVLFSRDILPQSFSPVHTKGALENAEEKEVDAPPAVFNRDACARASVHHAHETYRSSTMDVEFKIDKEPPNHGRGQGNLKSHRTGFMPYKRCSVEAKEKEAEPVEEKCNKRIHLESKASL